MVPVSSGPFPGAQAVASSHGRSPRVLLADDDVSVRSVVGLMCEVLGCSVTAVACGREALQKLSESPFAFDLVLADLTMEAVDGLQLARQAAGLRADLPVAILSGAMEAGSDEVYSAGRPLQFLQKPFTLPELAGLFRELSVPHREVDPARV